MAGSGILEKELKKQVQENNLQESVIFDTEVLKYERLSNLFYTADVFIAPQCGLTLVESALSSTPIVAYDFDWQTRLLRNGETGFIVPFGDVKKMAEKVKELLTNESLRKRIVTRCEKKIRSLYPSVEESMLKEKEIYRELIGI